MDNKEVFQSVLELERQNTQIEVLKEQINQLETRLYQLDHQLLLNRPHAKEYSAHLKTMFDKLDQQRTLHRQLTRGHGQLNQIVLRQIAEFRRMEKAKTSPKPLLKEGQAPGQGKE